DSGIVTYSVSGVVTDVRSTATGIGDVDTIHGSEDNDVVIGGAAGEFLYGDTGNDLIFGDSAHVAYGGGIPVTAEAIDFAVGGQDRIEGNEGDDVAVGGADSDTISGNLGRDLLLGDSGTVTFASGVVTDVTSTATGTGGADTDRIDGGTDKDLIFGDNVALDRSIGDGALNARFRALQGTQIYSTAPGAAGDVLKGASQLDPSGTPVWETFNITLVDHDATVQ